MKKFLSMFLCILFVLGGCGCSEKGNHAGPVVIDTTKVIQFTDEKISEKGCEILERHIIQRTNDADAFVIEYLLVENGKDTHYGYYVRADGGQLEILAEGEEIDRSVFEES